MPDDRIFYAELLLRLADSIGTPEQDQVTEATRTALAAKADQLAAENADVWDSDRNGSLPFGLWPGKTLIARLGNMLRDHLHRAAERYVEAVDAGAPDGIEAAFAHGRRVEGIAARVVEALRDFDHPALTAALGELQRVIDEERP